MKLKSGFTLMEVNLAVFIMAVGVLGMVALYPLGFRENQQSQDAVAGAALADAVLSPLEGALSSTNITFTSWRDAFGGTPSTSSIIPNNGWRAYCRDTERWIPNNKNSIHSDAMSSIRQLVGKMQSVPGTTDNRSAAVEAINNAVQDFKNNHNLAFAFVARYGTVDRWEGGKWVQVVDPSRIVLSVRAFRRSTALFSEPIYSTEVHFQGEPNL